MAQCPGEPADRDALHPDADERDNVAAGINPIIAVGEGKGDLADPTGKQAIAYQSQEIQKPLKPAAPRCRS